MNTLFNLNNGGGKTVLVQLMMQPVHPKAMAGGRRIEDYFSHTGDHSYNKSIKDRLKNLKEESKKESKKGVK